MNSGQELPRVKLNSSVRIANKFLSKRQLPNSWISYSLYEIFTKSITVHFEFLELSYFSDCIQTGFATQPPWNMMYKTRHALLGNSAHTHARTPLKWGSQNYTLCPCWSCHVELLGRWKNPSVVKLCNYNFENILLFKTCAMKVKASKIK